VTFNPLSVLKTKPPVSCSFTGIWASFLTWPRTT